MQNISIPYALIFKILLIFFVTATISYIAKKISQKTVKKRGINDGLKTLLHSFIPICNFTLWIYGSLLIIEVLAKSYPTPTSLNVVVRVRQMFLVIMVTWLLLSWKRKYEKILIDKLQTGKSKLGDKSLIYGIGKIASIALIIFAGMIILEILELNYAGIIAFGGIGGIAIGWAAKDVVANFFGGLMIHINRPFSIGDWIKSTNKNFEGVVEEIGWYMTRIRSFERRPTYIPNALITDAVIENPGRMYNRRIRHTFGIRYQDFNNTQSIINAIKDLLYNHPEIAQNQLLFVHLIAFNQYSIDIEIYCFTKKTQWLQFREIQQEILFKIGEIIKEYGAEIAFPTQTVYLEKTSSP